MALFPESLDEIDFWDLDMFTDGDPHLAWSRLRRDAPVWFHDRDGGEPFWCVTRYDDIHSVHADPVRFSSERHGIVARSRETLGVFRDGYVRGRSIISSMIPYSFACVEFIMKSRSTSRSMRSSGCPVCFAINVFVISRMRRISRA